MQLPAEHEENQVITKYTVLPANETESSGKWKTFILFLRENLVKLPLYLSSKYVAARTDEVSASAFEKVKRAEGDYERQLAEADKARASAEEIRERARSVKIDNDIKAQQHEAKTQELLDRLINYKIFIEAKGGVIDIEPPKLREGQPAIAARADAILPMLEASGVINIDPSKAKSGKGIGKLSGSSAGASKASARLTAKPAKKKAKKK